MKFVKTHKKSIILWTIVALVVILRFAPISFGDLYGDNALNSFRAYGWFDFLGNNVGQSTPFNWFGHIPLWGNLSFHDAPPLAFLIQKIFFGLFGDSVVAARLPFVLAGIGSISLVYLFLKKALDQKVALIAALSYAVSSYSAWAGQAGYLEGIEEFFIVGSLLIGGYFLTKARSGAKTDNGDRFDIETNRSRTEEKSSEGSIVKFIYLWSVFTACALLTKYTAIFLIPSILIFAFLNRKILKRYLKHTIISSVLFIVLLSPVIFYNAKVYETRGHFDAALSSMVGMHPDDFSIISERGVSLDVPRNIKGIFLTLADNTSYPLVFLGLICLVAVIWRARSKGWRSFESWILLNAFFFVLMFGFFGGGERFLSISVPVFVIVTALGIPIIYERIKDRTKGVAMSRLFIGLIVAILLFEAFYAFNTNVLKIPVGPSGWLHSNNKVLNIGFNQLDDFIRAKVIPVLPNRNIIRTKEDTIFDNKDVEGRNVVVFDDRINWFAQMWYFQRFFLYYRWPVISTAFLTTLNEHAIDLDELMKVSGATLYFIYPIDESVIDQKRKAEDSINSTGPDMAVKFDRSGVPSTMIMNASGIPVFKVYEISAKK